MGFSTSGSLLVIFFASFVALGTFYTATSNSTSEISAGTADQFAHQNEVLDTSITVRSATWSEQQELLTIDVENDGSTDLSVEATSVVSNGTFVPTEDLQESTVNGVETDHWAPAETLTLVHETDEKPDHVKIITETGIAERTVVEDAEALFWTGHAISLDSTEDDVNDSIEFDVSSSYERPVDLTNVTVEETDTDAEGINHSDREEVRLGVGPDDPDDIEASAEGQFDIGETMELNESVQLSDDEFAQFTIGEFRETVNLDTPVDMDGAQVTVTIGYLDPDGRTAEFTFDMEVDD